MRFVFHRNRHRAGWHGRIYLGRRFLDIGWFHFDPSASYLGERTSVPTVAWKHNREVALGPAERSEDG